MSETTIAAHLAHILAINRLDIILLCALLLIANAHLVGGGDPSPLVFLPNLVARGQWWRILTHPFVHVSWYHFMLDAGAFLMLYCTLDYRQVFTKVWYTVASAAGALILPWLLDPQIATSGYCGLSGAAHGLMVVTCMLMAGNADRRIRWTGLGTFALLLGKVMFETATGSALLSDVHLGPIGQPIALSHAGGILGGIATWIARQQSGTRSMSQDCP